VEGNGLLALSNAADGARSGRRPTLAECGLQALQVGVLVLDAADVPVLVNPAAREMTLVQAGGDGGLSAHPAVVGLARQVRRTAVATVTELALPAWGSDDDQLVPLGLNVRAVPLGDGYITVEAADVTEAHRLARVRRDFVANVSHELKTPVGALQLLAEALLAATDGAGDAAAARRFAERIRTESFRLGRLVGELIELSRLQGAEPLPERRPVAVDRIVAEVVDRTRTSAAAKDIRIEVTGPHGVTVYGDERQLVTAVANLVENAIAYSAEGTAVTIRTNVVDGAVEIAVVDQGVGIEPRERERIFERFYRADRARSRATGGTGLGLAIVKHVATNHGGRVEVTSTVGVGSTFTLRLPTRGPGAVPTQVSDDEQRS
jgi:two-component system, OmpR family, sensor histidine kinase SenX3